MLNKIKGLYSGSGLVLFCFRLPLRAIKVCLDYVTTKCYQIFLGSAGKGCHIEFGARIERPRAVYLGNRVTIGKNTVFVSEGGLQKLIIEDNVQVGRSCHIDHTGGLTIGENSLISEGVYIYTHSHGVDPRSEPIPIEKNIGRNCWIGSRSMILENCKAISSGSLVAAGSVVTKNIDQENLIVAGVPARKLKQK